MTHANPHLPKHWADHEEDAVLSLDSMDIIASRWAEKYCAITTEDER